MQYTNTNIVTAGSLQPLVTSTTTDYYDDYYFQIGRI